MESVVVLTAEWEMIKLQELSSLISDILKEWQDKENMELLGDQMWNEMNEEWGRVYVWRSQQPSPLKVDFQACSETDMGWCG